MPVMCNAVWSSIKGLNGLCGWSAGEEKKTLGIELVVLELIIKELHYI